MKDYRVVVKLHDGELEDGSDVLMGVFIANSAMDKIVLYSTHKGADSTEIGCICTTF